MSFSNSKIKMKLELTIEELGMALDKIEKEHKLNILVKSTLSGGWMTMTGEAIILKVPRSIESGCASKGNNIIDIKINGENQEGTIIKITGAKNKKFNVDISSTRYRELTSNNLTINQVKINENECKLRIDEDIIFTIGASAQEIIKLIEN